MKDQTAIDPVRVGFGMRLRAAREAVGLTQLDVGQRFDINKNTVSAWETGRGDPGVFRLMALSKLYKCSSESLLWENAPTNEAMQLAAEFDGLSARKQQTLRTLWLAFLADSKDDDAVENAMPITKAPGKVASAAAVPAPESQDFQPPVPSGIFDKHKQSS